MTSQDYAEIVGLLFGAYGIGWASGFMLLTIKRAFEVLK